MNITRFRIIELFETQKLLSEICDMKFHYLLLIGFLVFSLSSCQSEYEQRLEEAKDLRDHLTLVENQYYLFPSPELRGEIIALEKEIKNLAKISGDEELFLAEINLGDQSFNASDGSQK